MAIPTPLGQQVDARVKPGHDHLEASGQRRNIVMPGLDPGIHATYRLGVAYWVYILASRDNGTLYVGMTNDVVRRVAEHRAGVAEGFTKRYDVKRLVYFEPFDDPLSAIQREKNLKHWSRAWKVH
jgi:putative endonuclease